MPEQLLLSRDYTKALCNGVVFTSFAGRFGTQKVSDAHDFARCVFFAGRFAPAPQAKSLFEKGGLAPGTLWVMGTRLRPSKESFFWP
jgi:hypothetical protein